MLDLGDLQEPPRDQVTTIQVFAAAKNFEIYQKAKLDAEIALQAAAKALIDALVAGLDRPHHWCHENDRKNGRCPCGKNQWDSKARRAVRYYENLSGNPVTTV